MHFAAAPRLSCLTGPRDVAGPGHAALPGAWMAGGTGPAGAGR